MFITNELIFFINSCDFLKSFNLLLDGFIFVNFGIDQSNNPVRSFFLNFIVLTLNVKNVLTGQKLYMIVKLLLLIQIYLFLVDFYKMVCMIVVLENFVVKLKLGL